MEERTLKLEEKYPKQRPALQNLRFSYHTLLERTQIKTVFGVLLLPALYAKNAVFGITPLFREYGRLFGTHRVFRQYLYVGLIFVGLPWVDFYKKVAKTEAQLRAVEKNLRENPDEGIQPLKPIYRPTTF